MDSELLSRANHIAAELASWRRRLHRWPELGFQEVRTAAFVAGTLRQWGWAVREKVGITGVVAERGAGEPVVALRADMDALPVQEETGLPFASERPGLMHACGHDAHMAMLLGAARLLTDEAFEGTVRLLFQPSEESSDAEGLSGAARMIADGAMKDVGAVFGLHVFTDLPSGAIGVRTGAVQAAADSVHLTVRGRGAHAAQPHRGRDPIYIAAQVVTALQSVVSRAVDPLDPAVLTLGTIHGGRRGNIIPETVEITGTIRTLDEATRASVHDEVERVASGVATALGGRCETAITRGYPVTINDADLVSVLEGVVAALVGTDALHRVPPGMGAEDFSLLANESRGCFFRLGVTPEGQEPTRGHSPTFAVDESALPIGAAMLAGCALLYLTEAARIS